MLFCYIHVSLCAKWYLLAGVSYVLTSNSENGKQKNSFFHLPFLPESFIFLQITRCRQKNIFFNISYNYFTLRNLKGRYSLVYDHRNQWSHGTKDVLSPKEKNFSGTYFRTCNYKANF